MLKNKILSCLGGATGDTEALWIKSLFSGGVDGAWYDFTDLTTLFTSNGGSQITSDGQSVGYVLDKSGNGRHLTTAVGFSAPVYRTDGTKRWLEFNGNNALNWSGGAVGCANAFVSCRVTGYDTGGYSGILTNTGDQGTFVDVAFNAQGSGSLELGAYDGAGLSDTSTTWRNATLSNTVSLNTDAAYSANGSNHTSSSLVFPNGIMIGADRSYGGRELFGRVYGALVLGNTKASILGSADRNRVENFMMRFGTPAVGGGGTGSDIYFSNVSLLLHGDGTNGSQSFYDSSNNHHSVTTIGNAQVSTVQKKYGTGAMYFDGSGDYLSAPASAGFDFGTGDFTVEAWVNTNRKGSSAQPIFSQRSSVTTGISFRLSETNKLDFFNNDISLYVASTSEVQVGNWTHVAVSKASGTVRLFINGVIAASSSTTASLGSSTVLPKIGGETYYNASEMFYGYIDDLRVTKGVARYTANFTPPA